MDSPKCHHLDMELLYPKGDKFDKTVSGVEDLRICLIRVKSSRDRKIPFLGEEPEHINRLVESLRKMRKTIILRPRHNISYL